MPFDGLFLSCIAQELQQNLLNARIDRIYQPDKRELTIALRQPGVNHLLYLSAHPFMSRIHLAEGNRENPLKPPSFCMLMRKYWEGGRVTNISQMELERILVLEAQNIDEFGLSAKTELICEFMGKHSNIILAKKEADGSRKILGSLILVYPEMSRIRTILPGETYVEVPPQEKFNVHHLSTSQELFRERLLEDPSLPLKNALVNLIMGIGPLTAETLLLNAGLPPELRVENLNPQQHTSLKSALAYLAAVVKERDFTPSLLKDSQGNSLDFCALSLQKMLDLGYSTREYQSPSALIDAFFSRKEKELERRNMQSALTQLIRKEISRIKKKHGRQKKELQSAEKAELYKMQGEILTAFLYKIQKGEKMVTLPDIYAPEGKDILIHLDPSLSPAQNAQRFFKKYKKALTAKRELTRRLRRAREEINYLEGILFSTEEGDGETLTLIREELEQEGYIKAKRLSKQKAQVPKTEPLKFLSSDGISIYVGKNNRQNDYLTLKRAGKEDLWFHVKDIPGSHVIIPYGSPPQKTIQEAALLAAYYSRGRESSNVPVDYTRVKNVRKPKGAKPGMVIYDSHKTLYVTPIKGRLPTLTPRG